MTYNYLYVCLSGILLGSKCWNGRPLDEGLYSHIYWIGRMLLSLCKLCSWRPEHELGIIRTATLGQFNSGHLQKHNSKFLGVSMLQSHFIPHESEYFLGLSAKNAFYQEIYPANISSTNLGCSQSLPPLFSWIQYSNWNVPYLMVVLTATAYWYSVYGSKAII